ncbi:MAG: mRNA-decapping enzyme subunit 2 [Thelocarpon superellum]|nr:MAG: mRNA-decapping enzyme subunit 2 [Thelocarpon superellum]
MTDPKIRLEDWFDDLCVRFIINLPQEELESVERICFQVEEAQWFYEDFIRPLDPSLPSLSLRAFCLRIFQHCPLLADFSQYHHLTAFSEFLAYKTRVPVRGAIMLNEAMDQVVLVKGWKKGAHWSFPRGKINKDEKDLDCAVREVFEETGYDLVAAGLAKEDEDHKFIEITMREQNMRLYVFRGVPMDTFFEPRTRKEISKIQWHRLANLPTFKKSKQQQENDLAINANKFYMVAPFLVPLKKWIARQRSSHHVPSGSTHLAVAAYDVEDVSTEEELGHEPRRDPRLGHAPADVARAGGSNGSKGALVDEEDPSTRLKRLLSVRDGPSLASPGPLAPELSNEAKSNALLALLRKGSAGPPANPLPVQDSLEATETKTAETKANSHVPHPSQSRHPRPHPHPYPSRPSQLPPPPQGAIPSHPPHRVPAHMPRHPPIYPSTANIQPLQPPQPQSQHLGVSGAPPPRSLFPFGPGPSRPEGANGQAEPELPSGPMGHAPVVPSASKLPLPKLTSHSLALLNAFKQNGNSREMDIEVSTAGALEPVEASSADVRPVKPPLTRRGFSNAPELVDVSGSGIQRRQKLVVPPVRPTPHALQGREALAGQAPGAIAVELSALQSPPPGLAFRVAPSPGLSMPRSVAPSPGHDLPSAPAEPTLQGAAFSSVLPWLHASQPPDNGIHTPRPHATFASSAERVDGSGPKAFAPSALRRPSPPATPTVAISTMPRPLSFDRRGSQSAEHKQALLSLFSKASPVALAATPLVSPIPTVPIGAGAIALPHTTATTATTATTTRLTQGDVNAGEHPRSRISSLTTSTSASDRERSKAPVVPARSQTPITHADKGFLLGYLEGVARASHR